MQRAVVTTTIRSCQRAISIRQASTSSGRRMLAAIGWMPSLFECPGIRCQRLADDRVVQASSVPPRTLQRALYGFHGGLSRRVRIGGLPSCVLPMTGEPDEADDRSPNHQAHRVWDGNDEGTPARM